jgi:hypothetical protein
MADSRRAVFGSRHAGHQRQHSDELAQARYPQAQGKSEIEQTFFAA